MITHYTITHYLSSTVHYCTNHSWGWEGIVIRWFGYSVQYYDLLIHFLKFSPPYDTRHHQILEVYLRVDGPPQSQRVPTTLLASPSHIFLLHSRPVISTVPWVLLALLPS